MLAWPNVFTPRVLPVNAPRLRLYDSFRDRIIDIPEDRPFTMYVCGITPYDATHLGHAATYLTFDLIQRYLVFSGAEVRFLENVTDIDDPLFERARRDSTDWRSLGQGQIELFRSDMTNLRVIPPFELISVTETMEEIIHFVEILVSRGLTYALDGDLYLDASQITDFSDLPIEPAKAFEIFAERGGDPNRNGKRNPLDPLLWKKSAKDEPSWQANFGQGRPGWHVECNVIAGHLDGGRTISMQGGGEDLIFPHHYMTSLQGQAFFGHDFARTYVHTGMIGYKGEKMSKSRGNLVFVSRLLEDGVDAMAIRIALLQGHYRSEREWSETLLASGERLLDRLRRALSRHEIPDYSVLLQEMTSHLADDLDTPAAFAALEKYIDEMDRPVDSYQSPGALARYLDAVLGIAL